MERPERKRVRLKNYDYNTPGAYFITICTKEKQNLLCRIVGTAVPGGPQVQLTEYGTAVEYRLSEMSDFYDDVKIEAYVVMPNHVYFLLQVLKVGEGMKHSTSPQETASGPPGTAVPTSRVSRFIGTFKGLCTREFGKNIWQGRSYDHVVRDERDHLRILEYIAQNPARWREDRFYEEGPNDKEKVAFGTFGNPFALLYPHQADL